MLLTRFIMAVATVATSSAFGGTIITTGLPSGAAIVNIDARTDGISAYDTPQSNFYGPFSATLRPLEYTISAGTYQFTLVDPTDAGVRYPSLTNAQLGQIYTAWTYNTPWATDYLVFNSSALSNSNENQLFAGAVTQFGVRGARGQIPGGYDNAADAYQAAKVGDYTNVIESGPGGRYGGTVSNEFTFATAETVVFAIPDNILNDNSGGVSVLITPLHSINSIAPEPSTVWLLPFAFGILAVSRKKIFARREL